MAHDIEKGPYAKLSEALDDIDRPNVAMVQDPEGLYLSENVSDQPQLFLHTVCLFMQWALDQALEIGGEDFARELADCIERGIRNNLQPLQNGGTH